ncbi:hypothetical protein AL037_19045 [Salipiger aestuarii]|nr:hypothetical protein AL037_19045 [Salipiger aestuarii]
MQHTFKLTFKHIALDGLPIARAALGRAEIVWILFFLALRPARCQRLVTVAAKHESPQREVGADIFAGRSLGRALQTRLNLLEGLEVYQPFMLTFAQRHIPFRCFDVARIDHTRQHVVDSLIANFSARQVLRKGRLALQKAFDFDLRLETPRGVAFERFLQDRRIGLITHQHFALTAYTLIAIAYRCLKNPITVLHPCPHAVHGLLAILLALVL